MLINKEKSIKNNRYKNIRNELVIYGKAGLYLGAIAFVMSSNTAYADWFEVEKIKDAMIAPIYKLVNDNIGKIATVVGLGTTFLARGGDMYQRGIAFGVGALGTAGAIKLSQVVMPVA